MKKSMYVLLVAVLMLVSLASNAQTRKRIAIFRFDDRSAATANMNIGQRVTDDLISKLADSGGFEIIDREYLQRIQSEQNLKLDERFSAEGAAHLGKLVHADVIVLGQVDSFNANVENSKKASFVVVKMTSNGTVSLRVTARLVNVESGAILAAPSAKSEQTGVLAESTTATMIQGVSSEGSKNVQSGLLKLVDKSVEDIATQLSVKISSNTMAVRPASAALIPTLPKFVGIEDGAIVINKGLTASLKVGDKFNVSRPTDTGMKDPDTNQPIIRKRKVCLLTLSSVEDGISSGKCEGGTPQAGDDFTPVVSQ